MNKDQWINLTQALFTVVGGALATHGIGDQHLWETVSGAVLAVLTWILTHKWNAAPAPAAAAGANAPSSSQSGQVRLGLLLLLSALSALAFVLAVGCAAIQPGNDPIVVNAERMQTDAEATFDLVLGIDNSNRALWEQKAPAFHNFCEWLRQRQVVSLPDGTTTNVQRDIAMQINLDNVKLAYKASRASSNDVVEAMSTLSSAQQQASSWLVIVTNAAPATAVPK